MDVENAQLSLRGVLLDAETGDPLIKGYVFLPGTGNVSETDMEGSFEFQEVDYKEKILFKFVGFKEIETSVAHAFEVLEAGGTLSSE